MRLHIGKTAAEQFGDPLDRQSLGDVDELAAAVIAFARQAFGIFVGEHRALRLQHGAADDVLRGDQLDLVALAAEFQPDRIGDFGVAVGSGAENRVSTSPEAVDEEMGAGLVAGFEVADITFSWRPGATGAALRATPGLPRK